MTVFRVAAFPEMKRQPRGFVCLSGMPFDTDAGVAEKIQPTSFTWKAALEAISFHSSLMFSSAAT